jgi:dinuclear metal center YbgI/SA1388 family protein
MTIVSDVIGLIEKIAPAALAEKWDNSGLQIGDVNRTVKRIGVALDASLNVVEQACQDNIDLLITHHPLIFTPLKAIDIKAEIGRVIQMAIQHDMAIFAAHTNLDSAEGGINDLIAGKLELEDVRALVTPGHFDSGHTDPKIGMGRIGRLREESGLHAFIKKVKTALQLPYLRWAGDPTMTVETVALCSGSGGSLISDFISSGAHVYLSGDLRYHDARAVEGTNLALVDVGHFHSEHLVVTYLAERLRRLANDNQYNIAVNASFLEEDPFKVL